MFAAINQSSKTRVTSISSEWEERIEDLRSLARDGALVCPGCEQLLWLRTGELRRTHFAHRTLKDCPLAQKSPEVLEAQFHLYRWLESQYPGRVELDIPAVGGDGELLADIRVEVSSDRVLVFWIFDRQQRNRDQLRNLARKPGILVHFIHTESTLKFHSDDEIALTASQRDFVDCSDFDRCVTWGDRGHLHFLKSENGCMSVFRGLRCVHSPNLFGWELQRQFKLSEATLDGETGEIVCQEDLCSIKEWQEKNAQKDTKSRTKEASATSSTNLPFWNHKFGDKNTKSDTPASPSFSGPFRCEDCGEITSDWSSSTPGAGTCVCRQCTTKRHREFQPEKANNNP